MVKKNPIKKRVQGSQKPNPMPVGKPEKYMGDAEWEQYNEPQGINSPAAKRVMKTEGVEQVSSPAYGTREQVHVNPTPQMMMAMLDKFVDLNGIADDHDLYVWGVADVEHKDVIEQLGLNSKRIATFVFGDTIRPHRHIIISSMSLGHRDKQLIDQIFKSNRNFRKVFGRFPVDTVAMDDAMAKWPSQRKPGFSDRVSEELGPLGGFMAPIRGGDGKMAIPDTAAIIDPGSFERIGKENKRQAQKTRKRINKNIKKQKANPNFEKELTEMIRMPIFSLISGQYEVKNGEHTVGYAHVKDGVIGELTCASNAGESYRGEVLTHLINTIIDEADLQNSNLSLQLKDKDDDDMKRFLERFGFKHVGHGVMQRTAGSVRPPSVEYTSGQEGP